MFYTMKLFILLVAASVMLVGATIIVAIPNPAEATWCNAVNCFKSKAACIDDPVGIGTCVKAPKK